MFHCVLLSIVKLYYTKENRYYYYAAAADQPRKNSAVIDTTNRVAQKEITIDGVVPPGTKPHRDSASVIRG